MALYKSIYYPRMPIGKVWLYHLLLVCFCVCTVTDFSGEDKASGFQFCTVVFGRPGHGIVYFGDLCSPEAKIGRIGHPPGSKVQSGKSFRNCVLFKFARRVYGRPRRRTYSFFFFRLRINFSADNKASGVKFCTVVYRRPHFCNLCSPISHKFDESASVRFTRASPRAGQLTYLLTTLLLPGYVRRSNSSDICQDK